MIITDRGELKKVVKYWECLEHNTVYEKLQCPGCERDKAWGDLTGAIYKGSMTI